MAQRQNMPIPMLRLSVAVHQEDFKDIRRAAKIERLPYTTWCRRILRRAAAEVLAQKKGSTS